MMVKVKDIKPGDIVLFGTMTNKEWTVEETILKNETTNVYFVRIIQDDYRIMHIQDGNRFMNVVAKVNN